MSANPAGAVKTAPDATKTGIIWLASYPKSGNTWIRSFLFNMINIIGGEDPSSQKIDAINEYSIWDISAKRYEEILGKPPAAKDKSAVAAARPKVQEKIADELSGLSLVKTHNALVMDRGHPTINTKVTSGAVYIVRNPLDVAISFAHHMGKTVDEAILRMATRDLETEIVKKSVHEVYGSWSQHVYSWTRKPNPAIYVMRYEGLSRDPERVFGALASHLLIRPTKAQLAEAIDLSSFDRLRAQEDESGFKMKPETADKFFRKGKPGEWKEVLNEAQIKKIVTGHRDQMKRFGYVPKGY